MVQYLAGQYATSSHYARNKSSSSLWYTVLTVVANYLVTLAAWRSRFNEVARLPARLHSLLHMAPAITPAPGVTSVNSTFRFYGSRYLPKPSINLGGANSSISLSGAAHDVVVQPRASTISSSLTIIITGGQLQDGTPNFRSSVPSKQLPPYFATTSGTKFETFSQLAAGALGDTGTSGGPKQYDTRERKTFSYTVAQPPRENSSTSVMKFKSFCYFTAGAAGGETSSAKLGFSRVPTSSYTAIQLLPHLANIVGRRLETFSQGGAGISDVASTGGGPIQKYSFGRFVIRQIAARVVIRPFEVSSRTLPKAKTARFQMTGPLGHSAATSPEVSVRGIVNDLRWGGQIYVQNFLLRKPRNSVISFVRGGASRPATFARPLADKNMGSKSQLSRLHDKGPVLILDYISSISKQPGPVRGVATPYLDYDKFGRFVIRQIAARFVIRQIAVQFVIRLFGRPFDKGHLLILSKLSTIPEHEGTVHGVGALFQPTYTCSATLTLKRYSGLWSAHFISGGAAHDVVGQPPAPSIINFWLDSTAKLNDRIFEFEFSVTGFKYSVATSSNPLLTNTMGTLHGAATLSRQAFLRPNVGLNCSVTTDTIFSSHCALGLSSRRSASGCIITMRQSTALFWASQNKQTRVYRSIGPSTGFYAARVITQTAASNNRGASWPQWAMLCALIAVYWTYCITTSLRGLWFALSILIWNGSSRLRPKGSWKDRVFALGSCPATPASFIPSSQSCNIANILVGRLKLSMNARTWLATRRGQVAATAGASRQAKQMLKTVLSELRLHSQVFLHLINLVAGALRKLLSHAIVERKTPGSAGNGVINRFLHVGSYTRVGTFFLTYTPLLALLLLFAGFSYELAAVAGTTLLSIWMLYVKLRRHPIRILLLRAFILTQWRFAGLSLAGLAITSARALNSSAVIPFLLAVFTVYFSAEMLDFKIPHLPAARVWWHKHLPRNQLHALARPLWRRKQSILTKSCANGFVSRLDLFNARRAGKYRATMLARGEHADRHSRSSRFFALIAMCFLAATIFFTYCCSMVIPVGAAIPVLVAVLAPGGNLPFTVFQIADGYYHGNSAYFAGATTPHRLPDAISGLMPHGWSDIAYNDAYTVSPHGWVNGNHPSASPEQTARLNTVLEENVDMFAFTLGDLKGCTSSKFTAQPERPITQRSRRQRWSEAEQIVVDEKCNELKEFNFIRKAVSSDHVSFIHAAVVAAKKDSAGEWLEKRYCLDLRPTNEACGQDPYQMPLIDDLFDQMGKSIFFTTFDLRSGFLNILIPEELQRYYAFWWRGDIWVYTRMPFGHRNAPACYQRIMDEMIQEAGVQANVVVYIDDVVVHTTTVEEHEAVIRKLMTVFRKHQMFIHPKKTLLCSESVEFLGHRIHPGGISPHATKISAFRNLTPPTTQSGVRSVVGMLQFYNSYCPAFSALMAPINKLLRKDEPFVWGSEQQMALQAVVDEMAVPGKVLRRIDPKVQLHLWCDWSKEGIAGVLTQFIDGQERLCACSSRSCNKHERNYAPVRGEQLALIHSVRTFRAYLHGRRFKIMTDHASLRQIQTADVSMLTGQAARWAVLLAEFDFEIVYVKGETNLADTPSRYPEARVEDTTGSQLDPDLDQPRLEARSSAQALSLVKILANQPVIQHSDGGINQEFSAKFNEWREGYGQWGHSFSFFDVGKEVAVGLPSPGHESKVLRQQAKGWVTAASAAYDLDNLPASYPGPDFFRTSSVEGIVLIELCGGLCAGLEMILRNGLHLHRYHYSDLDKAATLVAKRRIQMLSERYSHLIAPSAFDHAFDITQDVRLLSAKSLERFQYDRFPRVLITAGFPCQDLSGAAQITTDGLRGGRSSAGLPIFNFIDDFQGLRLAGMPPVGFIIENVASQFNYGENARTGVSAYAEICDRLGLAVTFDAASVGARSHRVRNWWSNIAIQSVAQRVFDTISEKRLRPEGITANQVLNAGWYAYRTAKVSFTPQYPCNGPFCDREAMPTLVTHIASHAFRDGGSGMLRRTTDGALREPDLEEREQLMGYHPGATAAEGLTHLQRFQIVGNSWNMDQACAYFAVLMELAGAHNNALACFHVSRHMPTWAFQRGMPMPFDALEETYPRGLDLLMRQFNFDEASSFRDNGVVRKDAPLTALKDGGSRSGLGYTRSLEVDGATPKLLEVDGSAPKLSQSTRQRWRPGASTTSHSLQAFDFDTGEAKPYHSSSGGGGNGILSDFSNSAALARVAQCTSLGVDLYPRNEASRLSSEGALSNLYGIFTPYDLPNYDSAVQLTPVTAASYVSTRSAAVAKHRAIQENADQNHTVAVALDGLEVLIDPPVVDSHPPMLSQSSDRRIVLNAADPWLDEGFIEFVKTRVIPNNAAVERRGAIIRRAASYLWQKDTLWHTLQDGTKRIVSNPADRRSEVVRVHQLSGHMGANRTEALLRRTHWWPNMSAFIRQVLRECSACDQIRANRGNTQTAALRSLPLVSTGYRFSCDYCGGFQESRAGNKHIFIVVEHSTRWVEIWPTATKDALTTALLFRYLVIARFGAPAEVLTDGGPEFSGEFHDLMVDCMIDHRYITPGNAQANGLAERVVQIFKTCASKLGAAGLPEEMWDELMADVLASYRCTKQSSTKFSPYELIHAVAPTFPAPAAQRFTEFVEFDGTDAQHLAVVKELFERAALMRRHRATALSNLRVAQHRDSLRYSVLRSGAYLPKLMQFETGDLVYLSKDNARAGQSKVHAPIFQIVDWTTDGNAVCEGADARRVTVGLPRLRRCHLLNVDLTRDVLRGVPSADLPCDICKLPDRAHDMLLCDACGKGFHMDCLATPLLEVPEGDWFCPGCVSAGHVAVPVVTGDAAWFMPRAAAARRVETRRRDFHNRFVRETFTDLVTNEATIHEGRVRYDGARAGAAPFAIVWDDGETDHWDEQKVKRNIIPRGAETFPTAMTIFTGLPPAPTRGDAEQVISDACVSLLTSPSVNISGIAARFRDLYSSGLASGYCGRDSRLTMPLRDIASIYARYSDCVWFCPFGYDGCAASLAELIQQPVLVGRGAEPWAEVPRAFWQTPYDITICSPPLGSMQAVIPILLQWVRTAAFALVTAVEYSNGGYLFHNLCEGVSKLSRLEIIDVSVDGYPMVWICMFPTAAETDFFNKAMAGLSIGLGRSTYHYGAAHPFSYHQHWLRNTSHSGAQLTLA